MEASGELDAPRRQLEEYFAGERTRFAVDLDLDAIGGFRRRALEAMAAIPFGQTRSYRELAAGGGQSQRRAGGGQRLRDQPVAGDHALPPRAAQRRRRWAATSAGSR